MTVWSDVEKEHGFFFDAYYEQSVAEQGYKFPDLTHTDLLLIISHCLRDVLTLEQKEKEPWLRDLKLFGEENGFALTARDYKDNPDRFKGTFGQLMEVYRVALANKAHTPDLYSMIQIMGTQRAYTRLSHAHMWLKNKEDSNGAI